LKERENNDLWMSYEYGYSIWNFGIERGRTCKVHWPISFSSTDFTLDKTILYPYINDEISYLTKEIEYPVLLNTGFIGFTTTDLVELTDESKLLDQLKF